MGLVELLSGVLSGDARHFDDLAKASDSPAKFDRRRFIQLSAALLATSCAGAENSKQSSSSSRVSPVLSAEPEYVPSAQPRNVQVAATSPEPKKDLSLDARVDEFEQLLLESIDSPLDDIENITAGYELTEEASSRRDSFGGEHIEKSFYLDGRRVGKGHIDVLPSGEVITYRLKIDLPGRLVKTVANEYGCAGLTLVTTVERKKSDGEFAGKELLFESREVYRNGKVYRMYKHFPLDGGKTNVYVELDENGEVAVKSAVMWVEDPDGKRLVLLGESGKEGRTIDYMTVHRFDDFEAVPDDGVSREDFLRAGCYYGALMQREGDSCRQKKVVELLLKKGDDVVHQTIERDAQGRKRFDSLPHIDIDFASSHVLIVNGDDGMRMVMRGDQSPYDLRHRESTERAYKAFRALGVADRNIAIVSSSEVEKPGRRWPVNVLPDGRRKGRFDGDGVLANYKRALQHMKEELAKNGGSLVVYFTGHGDRGSQACVALEDYNLGERELFDDLSDLNCSSLLVINDHCYSGGIAERLRFLPGKVHTICSQHPFSTAQCQKFEPELWRGVDDTGDFSAALKSAGEKQTVNDPYMF